MLYISILSVYPTDRHVMWDVCSLQDTNPNTLRRLPQMTRKELDTMNRTVLVAYRQNRNFRGLPRQGQ